jgi:hypothetical protein
MKKPLPPLPIPSVPISIDELAALYQLALRAPKFPSESLWLNDLGRRIDIGLEPPPDLSEPQLPVTPVTTKGKTDDAKPST